LSNQAGDRMLAGASSGGICAFNAAWERPDAFGRVLSTIGTYIGLRGAEDFSTLIRKHEAKPIRVFLQDGSNDLNIYAGDWWVANQGMLSALKWAGYEVEHAWGKGGHNGKHGAAILPDALKFLWENYPEPPKVVEDRAKGRRVDVLVAGAKWEEVSSGHELASSPTSNSAGTLMFCDLKGERIYAISEDGKTRLFADQVGKITSICFGPNDVLYGCRGGKEIVRFDAEGNVAVVAQCSADILVAMPEGIYLNDVHDPVLWFCNYQGTVNKAAQLPFVASALAPTTDHAFMVVCGDDAQSTLHLRIDAPGRLTNRQRLGYLHMPYLDRSSGCTAIVMDHVSHPIVATAVGLQLMDQLGRVNIIIQPPTRDTITGLAFGGASNSVLFATAGEKVYRRILNTEGARPYAAPVQPPKPGL
ncbi:MAG TPA: gluconolactonase, partial [Planctomycetaceae bacterium]|nr:gluconolactonase [Planctomycetaceae bacterium]